MTKTKSPASNVSVAKKATRSKPSKKSGSAKGGPTAATRILEAIAGQKAMGNDQADRKTIQGLAAMPSKGSFATTLLNMKKNELIGYDKDTIWLTEKGVKTVGPDAVAKPQNNDAMQEKLKENIKGKRGKDIFDILAAEGKAYTKQELADKLGLECNKSFGTYISSLSKVSERVNGKIRLVKMAFPCGRPCGDE